MEYNYRNLVFEGGGVKGIAYGGALNKIQELNILPGIKRVAGTSAGAITASLLAVGYSPDEIAEIISRTNFHKFEDNTFFIIRDVIRIIRKFGWNKGQVFVNWIGELIRMKTGTDTTTFEDLKNAGCKDLYIVCTNVSKQTAEVLSYETTPHLTIKEAVRMSMGIPIFFAAIRNEQNEIIVDGAVTWNYPINIFDNIKYLDNPENGIKVDYNTDQDYVFNHETLGFRVDSLNEIDYSKNDWQTEPMKVKNIKQFVVALMNFTMEMVNKKHLHKNDWNRTVFVDSLNVQTTQFSLSKQQIVDLIQSGKVAVDNYFTWKKNDLKDGILPKKAM